MGLSAAQAAEEIGLSKGAVIKAIKTGKISAEKDHNGEWRIQPVELYRVYTPVNGYGHTNGDGVATAVYSEVNVGAHQDIERLQTEVKLLREMLAQDAATILDLRSRLDAADARLAQMTAVIAQLQPPKARVGWWQRLLGGG